MRHRTTFVLLILFLTGLGVLWWADRADVPTREQRQERLNRLLPELIDTPVSEIKTVEIDRRTGPRKDLIRLKRLGNTGWQIVEPVDTAGEPELIETFVRNLKDLRKSAVAGTIEGDPAEYGLKEPEAVVRVYTDERTAPVATIALGKATKDRGYVRTGGATGIEVVDPRRLSAATLPVTAWRDPALFRIPSFRVMGVTVVEKSPDLTIELERDERRWRLVQPIQVPADNDKAEGLVAELTALRVAENGGGVVAENVSEGDRAKYGLDAPSMTIRVTQFAHAGAPQTLRLGKAVANTSDEVYAMRGDQDEVVRLDVKRLREAIPGPNGLRSQAVLDLAPSRIDRIRIDVPKTNAVFDLAKSQSGWKLLSPVEDRADPAAVQTLLTQLNDLKTSEFLDPNRVSNPGLDPPSFRVRGWEPSPGVASTTSTAGVPESGLRFDLALGRLDKVKNTVYGRVAGDTTILALPESILEQLPRSEFAYRDRAILSVKPPQFARITVERERSSVTVEAPPTTGATGTKWKMTAPVEAPADESAITALMLTLGNLKAENWVSDRVGDGKAFGLDKPWLRVKWMLQDAKDGDSSAAGKQGVLRLGMVNPKGGAVFGNIEGDPRVFTLSPTATVYLEAELHSQKVMAFKADDAERVVLRWPSRTVAVDRGVRAPGAAPGWQVSTGYDPAGFDASRVSGLVSALSDLTSPRFLQYSGPFPADSGLATPAVSVEVKLADRTEPLTLRIGRKMNEKTYVATNATAKDGPVFVVTVGAWNDVLKLPARRDELPEDVFVPETQPARTREDAQPSR